jgi:hypothetical protein
MSGRSTSAILDAIVASVPVPAFLVVQVRAAMREALSAHRPRTCFVAAGITAIVCASSSASRR